jgi:hypothetical protein
MGLRVPAKSALVLRATLSSLMCLFRPATTTAFPQASRIADGLQPARRPTRISANYVRQAWMATSTTAMSITGDIVLRPHKITMVGKSFRISLVREISGRRLRDIAKIVDSPRLPSSARLYRTVISRRSRLVNGNTICGPDEDAKWMLTATHGDDLSLAFFSGEAEPNLDYRAVEVGHYLCATFGYQRQAK